MINKGENSVNFAQQLKIFKVTNAFLKGSLSQNLDSLTIIVCAAGRNFEDLGD